MLPLFMERNNNTTKEATSITIQENLLFTKNKAYLAALIFAKAVKSQWLQSK